MLNYDVTIITFNTVLTYSFLMYGIENRVLSKPTGKRMELVQTRFPRLILLLLVQKRRWSLDSSQVSEPTGFYLSKSGCLQILHFTS